MKKPLPPYNPSRMEEALRAGCDACGVRLGTHAATQLDAYARLLRDGSTRMNLTAILDDRGIGVRHFADSLSVLPLLLEEAAGASGRPEPFSVLDVGSGAGLPGIPLRIALDELALAKREEDAADPAGGTSVVPAGSDSRPAPPRIRITLLDALAKRVGFLEEVIRTLDLSDIEALHARAEDAAHGPLRERFDFVVARGRPAQRAARIRAAVCTRRRFVRCDERAGPRGRDRGGRACGFPFGRPDGAAPHPGTARSGGGRGIADARARTQAKTLSEGLAETGRKTRESAHFVGL